MELLSILEPAFGLIMWQIFIFSIILLGIIAFIDVAMNKFENNQQLLWLLICVFVPFGGLIYFSIGRKQRIRA
jgi:quinol-cytochrome oxidoreductase complex cytochrome b subunit